MLTLRSKMILTAALSSALTVAVIHPPRPNYFEPAGQTGTCCVQSDDALDLLTHSLTDANPDGYDVVIYEDGSGVQYDAYDDEVKTFPADTFVWDCTQMGNRICGPLPLSTMPE